MKVQKIYTYNMRNNAHFQFHTDFVKVVRANGARKLKITSIFNDKYLPAYRNVEAAQGKINKSLLTEQINDTDKARDETWFGLIKASNAGIRHFDPEVRNSAKKLKIIYDKYGGRDLARLPFNEQTAALNAMLQDLKEKYAEDIAKVGVGEWIEKLQNLNSDFNALMNKRYDESAAKCDIVLSQARAELDKVYNSIIDCINAFIELEGETDYEDFVRVWNAVIANYKVRK